MVWHIVRARGGEDQKAEKSLRNNRYIVYRPIMPRQYLRRNRVIPGDCSMFPGYLFVDDSFGQGWEWLRNSPGVLYFGDGPLLKVDGRLASIEDDDPELQYVRQLERSLWTVKTITAHGDSFKVGDRVQIKKGPWIEFFGNIETLDGPNRVGVLIEFLKRRVRVTTSARHLISAQA